MRRSIFASILPAVVAGAVVAVVFLSVDHAGGGTTTVVQQTPAGARPVAGGQPGPTAGQIYRKVVAGVVFVRSDIVQEVQTPFGLPQAQQGVATGTGFVIDKEGRILTNYHVISGASRVTVRFGKGKTVVAKVVGTDPSKDIALLKVDANVLTLDPLPLGRSKEVRVGDPVLAIGNPFGLDRTLTSGIVSALQRSLQAPNGFFIENVIQTDAAINPGNSGGPLLDGLGRVIGINSQIATGGSGAAGTTGGNVGIGFAVPIDTAIADLPELEKSGRVQRAWLGVRLGVKAGTVDPTQKLAVGAGALVASTIPGSPAAKAGLRGAQGSLDGRRGGDIIVAIDGRSVDSAEALTTLIGGKQPGDEVTLDVVRTGQKRQVKVKLGAQPARAPSQ